MDVVVQGFLDVLLLNMSAVPLTAGFTVLHILTLGYFFHNVCLDFEFLIEQMIELFYKCIYAVTIYFWDNMNEN